MSATLRGGIHREDYSTPDWLIEAIVPVVKEARPLRILEPACGSLAIVKILERELPDAKVDYFDIIDPWNKDFLSADPEPIYDVIITNPPYTLAEDFIKRANFWKRGSVSSIIMLVRLNFLGSSKRAVWLRKNLPSVYVTPKRPSFDRKGTDATEYAWMVWNGREPTVHLLDTENVVSQKGPKPIKEKLRSSKKPELTEEMKNLNFWDFILERIKIYIRKEQKLPQPWTDNKILEKYYFCNIYREWDKTTVWFRENVREYMSDNDEVIFATIIFRWFNRINVGELLQREKLLVDWDSKRAIGLLRKFKPIVTGAYIIRTPQFMNKLEGVCFYIDNMWKWRDTVLKGVKNYPSSLELQWKSLQTWQGLGPFMAYEVVTDLRHTKFGRYAHDIKSWANPGPGAKRGLNYLFPNDKSVQRLALMERLLKDSETKLPMEIKDERSTVVLIRDEFEMRDIEHALCEYAKYMSVVNGKAMKRLYHGTES